MKMTIAVYENVSMAAIEPQYARSRKLSNTYHVIAYQQHYATLRVAFRSTSFRSIVFIDF
jgi:hypothetical protein